MKLSDFSLFSGELIQFSCDDISSKWLKGESIQIQMHGDEFLIRQGDTICAATPKGNLDRVSLQVQQGLTLWLLRDYYDKTMQVQWLKLAAHTPLDITISVDEAIAEQLADKREIASADVQKAVEWLSEVFIVPKIISETAPSLGQMFFGKFDNTSKGGFELLGAGWRATVKQDKEHLVLKSFTRLITSSASLKMIEGNIIFQDASVAAILQSTEQQALLDAALRDNGSYLRLWQEYGKLEWEQAQDRAIKLGSLRFQEVNNIEGEVWKWSLKVNEEQLKIFRQHWKELGLNDETQVELGEKELDLDSVVEETNTKSDRSRQQQIHGNIKFDKKGIIFTPPQNRQSERPPVNGYIYYSLSGDETVQNRRQHAKDSIDVGRRLPQLSYLLEGVAPPIARRRQLIGLSPYAKACFKATPTERQKLAIDVAINTPDIALIVGPPGTGKTQVIAALQRRLAETLGEQSLQHQVLISSFQHDAVDNALNRVEVFGLPAVRIGGKNRRNEGGVDPVGVWCERKQKEISNRLDSIKLKEPLTRPLAELNQQITALKLASLSPAERQSKFKQVDALLLELNALDVRLPPKIKNTWDEFLSRQTKTDALRQTNENTELIRILRSLRTSHAGYCDDGSDRVYQLERVLRRAAIDIEASEWSLLQRLSKLTSATNTDLTDLAKFKNSLLDNLKPDYRPPQIKKALNGDALEILAEIEKSIDAPLRQSRRGILAVLAAYEAALAPPYKEAGRAVQEYASIVGATCQQSAGKSMNSLKELSDLEATEGIEFDTVIIDEAARANPLDLFVPMAMARRRIVLVGDHRQLPHLVQRELEDELISRQELNDAQAKAYEQSLFERLVKQLREQEKIDNIKRVVMLDTQYRMHPILGDFISQQFYESAGLDVLHSGHPASDFLHDIPGYKGKCAAWLDVPLSEGNESNRGPSRVRQVEAAKIAREVKRIADACPTLSIGVISFYRAQCNLILEEFVDQGLTEKEDDEIRIARPYRQTESGDERIRIGTVDSFQGKEFDVVFLSIVRANDKTGSGKTEDAGRDRVLTNKYGHLRVANRLNVAMSRQRKLLIAVGAKSMAEGVEAEEAVPAIAAFLKLCRKEDANAL